MRPIRSLVLWPTAACNLDCVYCYRAQRRGGRMPHAVAAEALAMAERTATASAPVQVQLAGGEPTLVPDLVEEVVTLVAANPGRMYAAIQTNATRLDVALADLFRRHRVQVGVSVDGPPDVQDELRGQAQQTFAGLDLLAARGVAVRVTAVLTAVNASRLGELAVLLAAYPNVVGLALDPLVPLGSGSGRPELAPDEDAVRAGATDLYHRMTTIARLRGTALTWRELQVVRRNLRRPASTTDPRVGSAGHLKLVAGQRQYCHASRGESLAVAPDGSLFPCSQSVGDPRSAVGRLGDLDSAALERRFSDMPLVGPCERCAMAGRCPGDCPSRVEAWRDRPTPPTPAMCVLYDTLARLEEVA